jgi:hypothetical protein
MGGTPDEVTTYIASESARWAEVVKTAGIRMDDRFVNDAGELPYLHA